MRGLAERKGAGLLYGTNFSVGVQVMLRLTEQMTHLLAGSGYTFRIEETHHASKLDAPSGTAVSLQQVMASAGKVEIVSNREGEIAGIHEVTARSDADSITLRHEAFSRRAFAEGAVRAAEWLQGRTGSYDFREIYPQL